MSVIGSQNAGIVELGEKTLAKLFEVKVPDKTDITWIAEKQRLLKKYQTEGMTLEEAKAEVKMNKPLGREQRTITKQANIAQSGLSTADKLDEISEEVSQGRSQSRVDRALVMGQLRQTIAGVQSIARMTKRELDSLKNLAMRADIPSSHSAMGITERFVDKDFYDNNSGNINLLFVGKLKEFIEKGGTETKDYNINYMVKDFSADPSGMPAKSLGQMYKALGRKGPNRRFLDLLNGGIIKEAQLLSYASSTPQGFASNLFSIGSVPIRPLPPARPRPPPRPAKPAVIP
jgi:hypothetical protein